MKNVRPFLDVVPSGASNADISGRVDKVSAEHGPAAFLLLALLLVQISHLYQWIIIDFSPSDKNNQRLGLAASTHLVAPVKGSDDGVLEGLGSLARLVRGVRVINPEVSIAAIGFLGFKKVKGEPTSELVNLREKIELLVANARLDPEVVISAYVREAPVLAALCRNTGMPAKELALAASGKLADPNTGVLVPRPRDENDRLVEPQRATDLADDYTHFAAAVLHQIRRRNKQLRGEA